jgi:hypothetical protein
MFVHAMRHDFTCCDSERDPYNLYCAHHVTDREPGCISHSDVGR